MKNNKFLQVLSIRPFLFLWLAEVFSQIAMNMINFVLITVVYELSKSNTAVSGVVLSFTVPAIAFGIIAGVYVDHWNKKSVLFLTNVIRMILLVILAMVSQNLAFVYFLSFLISSVTQFFIPAETPMIPVLVKEELLLQANALFGMGIYASVLIAYALSGPFLIFFGKLFVFYVLALFFLIAAVLVTFITTKRVHGKLNTVSTNAAVHVGNELKRVFSLMLRTKEVYSSLFLIALSQMLILILAVIGPGYAVRILSVSVNTFPLYFITPAAMGMVIGAIIIGNYLGGIPKQQMANTGVFLSGLGIFLLPYGSRVSAKPFILALNQYLPHYLDITILHIMVVLAFLLGFANALVFVPSNTIIQEKTSEAVRGKIYGSLNAFIGIFSLLPVVVVGGLADVFGVGSVLSGIGIVVILLGLYRSLMK